MVNVPKVRNTFCKGLKCRKHTQHKVTQYKKGKDSVFAQGALINQLINQSIRINSGKRRYDRKQQGFHGQTKPVQRNKCKVRVN